MNIIEYDMAIQSEVADKADRLRDRYAIDLAVQIACAEVLARRLDRLTEAIRGQEGDLK